METQTVTEKLIAVVEDLPPERQQQLLELAKALAKPQHPLVSEEPPRAETPLVERDGLLLVSARLVGPFVDHREVREEYLDRLTGPVE